MLQSLNTHLFFTFCLCLTLLNRQAFAQDEFFQELEIEKVLSENEKYEFTAGGQFKNLLAEPTWTRVGVSFAAIRRIERFRILGRLNSYYTFNYAITNFFEVRPLIALQYVNLPIIGEISLRQRLQYEWRLFYTDDENSERQNYRRLRYQIGIDIPIPSEKESSWTIRPFFEWFFIRDPATFERFPNERDYGVTAIKELKNEHRLTFTYRLEEFYQNETEKGNGHIFFIGYAF